MMMMVPIRKKALVFPCPGISSHVKRFIEGTREERLRDSMSSWQPRTTQHASVRWEGKKGSTDGRRSVFLSWTSAVTPHSSWVVMNGIGTQTERTDGRTAQFRNSLNCLSPFSPLHPSGVCRCGSSLSLHFLILIRPLRESDLNPA